MTNKQSSRKPELLRVDLKMHIEEHQKQISLNKDSTSRLHSDELPTRAGIDQLDKLRFGISAGRVSAGISG